MKKIKCEYCNETIEVSDCDCLGDILKQDWIAIGGVNGLTTIKACPKCFGKAISHLRDK